MGADLALRAPVLAGPRPGTVVAFRAARASAGSAVLWGYVFGLTVASAALGYTSTYKTPADRARFAALFGSNAGLAAIAGPARDIQTIAGYTAWKCTVFLSILGAVWGLLTATRLLRGEEEAGRYELLLAGQTTRRRAAAQSLAGLGAGLAVLWTLTAVITVAVGRSPKVAIAPGPALYFALTLVAAAAMFLAAGALASQLAATRRQAAAYCGAALGGCYALRMVADSATGLAWLRWTTPLGWIETLRPLTGPHPLGLLPIAALTALLAGLAVHLAGRRDLGASVLPDRAGARARPVLLSGPAALAVRLARPALLGWAAGIAALALLMGFIAKQAGVALSGSASIQKVLARLGEHGGTAATYLGFTFVMVAVIVAFLAAQQVTTARAEEASGRLDHILVRPVSRTSWLAGRVAIAAAVLAAGGLLAGLSAWAGAASQHAGVSLPSLLGAGLNLVAPALCVLGAGLFTLGVRPRAATAVTYAVLAWSLLVELAGGFFGSNHWLLDTSVFHQMAAAPAVSPDWASAAAMTALAAAAIAAGAIRFSHRDLAGE
jgi:ABC-2 type transport system permease protein